MTKFSGVAFEAGAERTIRAIANPAASRLPGKGRRETRLSMARTSPRFSALLQARIERVAKAVTEEIEAQHGDEDGQPRKEREPGVGLDESHVGLEVPAPARRGRLRAQA